MLVEKLGVNLSGLDRSDRRHWTRDWQGVAHRLWDRKRLLDHGRNIAVRGEVIRRDWFWLRSFHVRCIGIDDSCPDTELKLGFGGAIQLLVDRNVIAIEGDVETGTIRVAFEDDILGRWTCD